MRWSAPPPLGLNRPGLAPCRLILCCSGSSGSMASMSKLAVGMVLLAYLSPVRKSGRASGEGLERGGDVLGDGDDGLVHGDVAPPPWPSATAPPPGPSSAAPLPRPPAAAPPPRPSSTAPLLPGLATTAPWALTAHPPREAAAPLPHAPRAAAPTPLRHA
ncbi:basic proline-rich protein-like [Panicum virgatum]|uniref:basic proline-rich protein-like n=1 Tax=Panicum virgatum TaxID=38727 RepID=UPI0019D5D337|nr:basic proline-rich protein-like [Panicum virgatum]